MEFQLFVEVLRLSPFFSHTYRPPPPRPRPSNTHTRISTPKAQRGEREGGGMIAKTIRTQEDVSRVYCANAEYGVCVVPEFPNIKFDSLAWLRCVVRIAA